MKSIMAMEDCRALMAEGLTPQPEDVVRLNALALDFERAKGRASASSPYYLPRVAFIAEGVWFREPTLGHELWTAKVSRWANTDDYQTLLAVQAYALSRDCSALPNGDDVGLCRAEIEKFALSMGGYTTGQIFAAVDYVRNGFDPAALETAANGKSRNAKENADEPPDFRECVALGIMREGQASLLGITLAELAKMTRREAEAVMRFAFLMHKIPIGDGSDAALRDYYRTLDEIRERLENERAGKGGDGK